MSVRRGFAVPALWRTLAAALALAAQLVFGGEASAAAVSEQPAELAAIARKYGIEVIAKDPVLPVQTYHGKISGKPAGEKELADYTALFSAEFNLYPPELVKRTKLKRVVLCRELSFGSQLRGAIPDYEHDTLYLDVNRGGDNPAYLRKEMHHEFFHVIDYQDDGEVYRDEQWAALNPAGFKYGNGGRNAQGIAQTGVLTNRYPGFLNHYSMTGVEEDKAEIFAHLLVNPVYVVERAEADAVIRAKVRRMRELVANFCPEADEEFWKRAKAMRSSPPRGKGFSPPAAAADTSNHGGTAHSNARE